MRVIVRRDTAEAWAAVDTVLGDLEPALDLTNDLMKLGDGIHKWSELPEYRKASAKRTGWDTPLTGRDD
jgi:hypothetical protein